MWCCCSVQLFCHHARGHCLNGGVFNFYHPGTKFTCRLPGRDRNAALVCTATCRTKIKIAGAQVGHLPIIKLVQLASVTMKHSSTYTIQGGYLLASFQVRPVIQKNGLGTRLAISHG